MTGDRSVADVLHDVVRNLQDIVRSEVRLAKAEIRQEATQAVSAGAWLAASVVAAVSAWMCLVWTAVYGLAIYMSIWVATLVVAVVMAAMAAGLLLTGLRKLRRIPSIPERTIETLKENLEWLRKSTK